MVQFGHERTICHFYLPRKRRKSRVKGPNTVKNLPHNQGEAMEREVEITEDFM